MDCTVGMGGHSCEIAKLIFPEGRLIGIDRDKDAIDLAYEKLKNFKNYNLVHQNFKHIDTILKELNIEKVDGLLFDLGICSFQLDNPQRGFSFKFGGYLDMRMNKEDSLTAFDLVNNLPAEELEKIFREYSQERYARRIAQSIVKTRGNGAITTTIQLADLTKRAIPRSRSGRTFIHPATRVFQALRIAVNQELENLSAVLSKAIDFLKPKGRICVLSFHSGEDRIVKNEFKNFSQSKTLNILTKKPITSSREEIFLNPRARSAKLRAGEKK